MVEGIGGALWPMRLRMEGDGARRPLAPPLMRVPHSELLLVLQVDEAADVKPP